MSRATQAELLEQRIVENTSAQEIDLGTWIFERLRVEPDTRILELCCGTGGQTIPLLERVGAQGAVIALDTSRAALSTLASKAATSTGGKLTCIEGTLEGFSSALRSAGLAQDGFDLIFCAYGLYYSADAEKTLREARSHLRPGGRIVIVGPFGPNNKPLFDLVRAAGASISEPVIYSSESFMVHTVLPWGARNFAALSVYTMVNHVRWTTADRVLNYWKNSTFYDEAAQAKFGNLLQAHFAEHPMFVNEKWVMMAEMSHVRA
jgi:ubiquinone/menaquinone biosynthesis C-methylase UbiE